MKLFVPATVMLVGVIGIMGFYYATLGDFCDKTAPLAVVKNMQDHPRDWSWDGYSLRNEKAGFSWDEMFFGDWDGDHLNWGTQCKRAIWKASASIRAHAMNSADADIVAHATKNMQ